MKLNISIPRKYKHKVTFTYRLFVLGLVFYGIWWFAPNLYLMKYLTASLVAYTTGSLLITGVDGIFVRRGGFLLRIITDCTAWKELFVFLALFFSWPKKKSYRKAFYSVAAILVYNILRLDVLVLFPGSFDYFHPSFQYVSVAVILFLWTWSVGITKLKVQYSVGRKRAKRKTKKRKKK